MSEIRDLLQSIYGCSNGADFEVLRDRVEAALAAEKDLYLTSLSRLKAAAEGRIRDLEAALATALSRAEEAEKERNELRQRDYEDVLEGVELNMREVMRYLSKSQELAHRLFRVSEKKREGALGRLLECIRRVEGLVQRPELTKFQQERSERTRKTKDQLQRTSVNLQECRAEKAEAERLLALARSALERIYGWDFDGEGDDIQDCQELARSVVAQLPQEGSEKP